MVNLRYSIFHNKFKYGARFPSEKPAARQMMRNFGKFIGSRFNHGVTASVTKKTQTTTVRSIRLRLALGNI